MILVSRDDKGIQCDGPCDRWFHVSCTSLSQAEYSKLSKDNSRKWSCGRDDCVNSSKQPLNLMINQLSQLSKVIGELVTKVDQLTPLPAKVDQILEQVDDLNKNLVSLEQRVHVNETKIASLEESVKNLARSDVDLEKVVSEVSERNRRASNIMVYGLPESTSQDTQTRINHDLDKIAKLINSVLPEFSIAGVKAYRLGKKSADKSRPLKLLLKSEHDARSVLSVFSPEAAKDADPDFSSVKLGRDRTPNEQKYLKSLAAELEERKLKGELNLTIKYKNNIPSIVKISKND